MYQTTDLTLTSFLRCRGFHIENIKQVNGRTLFIFQETPELRTIAPNHAVSCHRAEELTLQGVATLAAT